jgi:hypothetical protein
MANSFIGTIWPNSLGKRGFNKNFGRTSLETCFNSANVHNRPSPFNNNRGSNFNYITFLPDNPSNNSLQSTGLCAMGNSNYNLINDNIGNAIGAYRVYKVDPCVSESCIRSRSKSVLRDAILQQRNKIKSNNNNINTLDVRLTAITDNIDDATASIRSAQNRERIQREENERRRREQLAQQQELLNNIRLSQTSSRQLLSDKNRLIASTSSNIQTSTDKLEELNNKINEANQEIAKNNADFEKKNNIITTLRAMITIFFILLLVMIVYYGALYTRDTYPETYNSISNTINNSFSGLSGFSSFNANY